MNIGHIQGSHVSLKSLKLLKERKYPLKPLEILNYYLIYQNLLASPEET